MSEFLEVVFWISLTASLFVMPWHLYRQHQRDVARAEKSDEEWQQLNREIFAEMLSDTAFARWADDFGLQYHERDAAWSAWKQARKGAQ